MPTQEDKAAISLLRSLAERTMGGFTKRTIIYAADRLEALTAPKPAQIIPMPSTAAYAPGNTASQQAAVNINYKLTGKRVEVLNYIRNQGARGATGSEIAEALDMLLYTAKPRCTELYQAGYVVDSGITRLNKNQQAETVWMLASYASAS